MSHAVCIQLSCSLHRPVLFSRNSRFPSLTGDIWASGQLFTFLQVRRSSLTSFPVSPQAVTLPMKGRQKQLCAHSRMVFPCWNQHLKPGTKGSGTPVVRPGRHSGRLPISGLPVRILLISCRSVLPCITSISWQRRMIPESALVPRA